MRGGSGQDPSWLCWQSLAPGWVRRGLTPNAGPAALVPSSLTKLQMGQASGTALPPHTLTHRHAGTLSYHNIKIKGWKREKKKKRFSSVCCWGPRTQVGACALGRGRLALKESSMGAGGYRVGTSTEIMYKGRDAPTQPPTGLNWLMGVGCM